MKTLALCLATLLCTFTSFAQSSSQSVDQFCADRGNSTFAKHLTASSENLMAFSNHGGLMNGGVCWWHSRFQRNALYLTYYSPGETRPTSAEAAKIVEKIRSAKEVVEIPGFRNFSEFSYAHSKEIQEELEKWQKSDGIVKFNWVIGLKGKTSVEPDKMKELMDELYQYVEVEGNIAYEKLQIKGVDAHAWLVVNVKPVDKGYDLEVIDSNYPNRTSYYSYREGQTHFHHYYYGDFTPYLERKGELEKVKETIAKKCD